MTPNQPEQITPNNTTQIVDADPEVTRDLPVIAYGLETDVAKICGGGASSRGMSAMQNFLGCPERARLQKLGVRRKRYEGTLLMTQITNERGESIWIPDPDGVQYGTHAYHFELKDPLEYGSVAHHLRAVRILHGQEGCEWVISQLNVTEEARLHLLHTFRIYDNLYPLVQEPFRYLGVECEVRTDVGTERTGVLIRTVRYDSVIVFDNGQIFSFECKTASRSGYGSMEQYTPQACAQVALWNRNQFLVSKYGPMAGVIYDHITKGEVPTVTRHNPKYVSKLMQARAVEYMRLPNQIVMPMIDDAEGGPAYPRFMHSCFGRYRPCEFLSLCYENSVGDYVWPEGSSVAA